jgi:hypothetical protein
MPRDVNGAFLGILLPTVHPKVKDSYILAKYDIAQFKRLMKKFKVNTNESTTFATIAGAMDRNSTDVKKTGVVSRLLQVGRGVKRALKRNVLGISTSMSNPARRQTDSNRGPMKTQQTNGTTYRKDDTYGCVIHSTNAAENLDLILRAAEVEQKDKERLKDIIREDLHASKWWFCENLAKTCNKHIFIMTHQNKIKIRRHDGVVNNRALVLVDTNVLDDTDFSSLSILQNSTTCETPLLFTFDFHDFEKLLIRLSIEYSFRSPGTSLDHLIISESNVLKLYSDSYNIV